MFERFKRKQKLVTAVGHFDSLIAASMSVNGPITFGGSLKIDGTVNGSITATVNDKGQSTVVIEKTGCVIGDIKADVVIVHGEVRCNIYAKSILLAATAKLPTPSTLTYDIIQVEAGAMCRDVQMKSRSGFVEAPVAEQKAEQE